jgi:CheY-like chemotaxis protein
VAVGEPRVTNYFCPSCRKIVLVDLLQDKIKPSPNADSPKRKIERKKQILVADDNERVRTFAVGLLRAGGYDVLEAEDGLQALALTKEKRPDLIVLNLMLPLMTGYDLIEEIKKNTRIKDTPIVLMSDVVSEREVFGTLDASDIVGFIDKRQIKDSLVLRVQECLQKSGPQPV